MPVIIPRGPGGGGTGGAGSGLGPPTNTFATEALRDTYAAANAAWLADYNENRFFWIRTGTTVQRRNAAGDDWEPVTRVIQGPEGEPGRPPTNDEITAAVQGGVKPFARTGGRLIAESDADEDFVLSDEITSAFLLSTLGLTQTQLNDLFLGAEVSGSGASRVITVTQKDGTTITLAVPDTTGGGGGGSGSDDGVITGAAFASDGTTLTISRSVGAAITVSVPEALRDAGLDQVTVNNLIAAHLANYRRVAEIAHKIGNYQLISSDRGSTIRLIGDNSAIFEDPDPAVEPGWWVRLTNVVTDPTTTTLAFRAPVILGVDHDGVGKASLEIAHLQCVTVQFVGSRTWAVIADSHPGGEAMGTDQTARDAVAANAEAIAENLSRIGHLERRGGATLELYHLGNGSEQYTQAQFAALTAQNLTITGHILDTDLIPDGDFFLRIHNGRGGQILKTMAGAGSSHLQIFQQGGGGLVERATPGAVIAGLVLFTFQITAAEMGAIFTDSSNQSIEAAFVEFDVGTGRPLESSVLTTFYQHLVGTGITPEQAIEISRNGAGVLLARQEASEAKSLAEAAQEQVEGEATLRADGDTTLSERIDGVNGRVGNLERDFLIEPNYWLSTAAARTIIVHLNSGNVPTGANRIRLVIGGATKTQNITAGDTDYAFDFTTADATNIRNNLRGASTISSNLQYLNAGGDIIATQHVLLRVLAAAPAGIQFVRKANAAALSATVPAGTVEWYPE